MALVVKGKVNINEFIDLTKMEKILPSMFTPVKSVMCSKVDKIMVHENESLSEVNLLKGVKLIDSGYVCLAGLVVTGEWNLPDNCRGGVSVCLVDKRMERADEATLGSYYTAAAKKRFQFKIVELYVSNTVAFLSSRSTSKIVMCLPPMSIPVGVIVRESVTALSVAPSSS